MTKHVPSEEEKRLFRTAVGPVKPVRQDKVEPERTLPPPQPLQTRMDEQQVLRDMISDGYDPADLETGEELHFARPGLQHSLLRRLRRGHFSVGAALDLHGMTVAMARQALAHFLGEARRHGIRCVRIVHGKGKGSRLGQPVLKRKLNLWLRQRDQVLAFCSARPVDGGTGAVYVLLKLG